MNDNSLTLANNDFTLSLLKYLLQQSIDSSIKPNLTNYFVSPFNVAQVLTMLLMGCKENTYDELSSLLAYDKFGITISDHVELDAKLAKLNNEMLESAKAGGITLEIGNGVYPDNTFPLNHLFAQQVIKNYKANIKNLDFQKDATHAESNINNDIAKSTHDKIRDLIPKGTLDAFTVLVLTSAIYFKGDWADKFDSKLTQNVTFTMDDGKTQEIPMMQGMKKCWLGEIDLESFDGNCEEEVQESCSEVVKTNQTVKILRLDYVGGDGDNGISMYILLPEQGKLGNLVSRVEAAALMNIIQKCLRPEKKVRVTIPKFKINYEHELKETLQNMGLNDIIGNQADLSGLTDTDVVGGKKRLYLSKVFHKAFIEVNEEGSEAAAATAGVIMMKAMLVPREFCANRPFLYFIAENKHHRILFIGTFNRPST